MKKIIFFILRVLIFCFICLHSYGVFAASGILNNNFFETKNILSASGSDFDYLILGKDFKLKTFFKQNLNENEKTALSEFINEYVTGRDQLEIIIEKKKSNGQNIIDETKDLLNQKKIFYTNILNYIKLDEIKGYIDYIATDIKNIMPEKKDMQIIPNASEKIDKIEIKILQHSNILDTKFKALMEDKINDNITKLINNPQFQALKKDQKQTILESLMKKIDTKLGDLGKLGNTTDTFNKQKEVYQMLGQKLLELKQLYDTTK